MNISAIMREPGALCAFITGNIAYRSSLIRQFMRISLVVTVLLLTTFQLLLAMPGKAQDMAIEKVTVGLKAEPLENAIKQIEQQTTLRFFYRKADINTLGIFNMPSGSRTIEQTLYALLQNSYFTFRQVDQSILIQAGSPVTAAKRKITGVVLAADTKEPIKFAMVEVITKKGLQLAGQTNTDSTGHFEIIANDNAEQLIRVSLLGYQVYSAEISSTGNQALSAIYLQPDPKVLQEVVVSAHSPLIRQEVDRLSYNVQADPENKFNSVLDMLRKVPLLSVDADDNVKLKGSSSFKVLIDGHASSLVVNDPKEIFRSMSASNIQRIEVITIPPAKYDSEGLAGIINIITIKKIKNGYSGNAGLLYKFPNGPRGNGSINLKSGKFALSAYGGLTENDIPLTTFTNQRNGNYPAPSVINQEGSAHTKNRFGFISSQVSYEIDSLNLVSAIINYNGGNNHRLGTVATQITDSLNRAYQLDNDRHGSQHGYELGVDYQLGFKRNKGQLLSFSYRFSDSKTSQLNALNASGQVNYDIDSFTEDNKAGTDEHTLQLDYTHPLKNLEIEGGIKTIFRNNFSDYNVNVVEQSGDLVPGGANTDDFTYRQNIYSIYNSYQLSLNQWTAKAGLRLERTTINADFSLGGALTIPDYNNLIPSVAIQRKLSQSESLNFGYTERIQRPGILQLNPYVDQQNPDFISYGNPGLKPEINHILSVNYGLFKNTTVNIGLSYSFSNNTIQYISTLGADGITRGTYENLGTNNSLEADLSLNIPISQRINFSFNGQVSRVLLKGAADSMLYSRRAFIGNCYMYLSYKFEGGWRTGLDFQYYSPAITLQGTSSPYYYSSISIAKTIFNKKLNVYGSVSNPYQKYLDYKYTTIDPRFTALSHNDIVYRRFNIGVNYSFGKLKEGSVKKNKKTVQNDDIKVIPSVIPNN